MARTITVTADNGYIIDVVEDGVPLYRDRIGPTEAAGKTQAELRQIARDRHDAWKVRLNAQQPRLTKAERKLARQEQRRALVDQIAQLDADEEADA